MSNFVYIHICPNDKRYVGITQREPEVRWCNGNGYIANKHFFAAIQKYGWENIKHIVYEVETKEEMWYLEKYLIAYYNTTDREKGYNHSTGGEKSSIGFHHTGETKRRLSIKHKGKSISEETRKKLSESNKGCKNAFYGKHHTEETKEKLRIPKTEETRKKLSESNKGKHLTIETRQKISEAGKGRKHSRETRMKISKSHEGICPVKLKWLTPDGEIRYMDKSNVSKWHPDWTRIE